MRMMTMTMVCGGMWGRRHRQSTPSLDRAAGVGGYFWGGEDFNWGEALGRIVARGGDINKLARGE